MRQFTGIMCTIGGLSRHIGRQWTDISANSGPIYRPTVDRYIGRQSTDKCAHISRKLVDISVDYRSTIGLPINVYISGDALVDYRSIYRSTIGRLSAYMSTEATYSTHDPFTVYSNLCKGNDHKPKKL